MQGDGRHLLAAFGAFMADGSAFFHIPDTVAVHGAGFADFGAGFAGKVVEPGTAQHEVCRQLADFGAVHHQAEVFRLNVPSAHFQAMIHRRLQAGLGATVADVDTRLHGEMGGACGLLWFGLGCVHDRILQMIEKRRPEKRCFYVKPGVAAALAQDLRENLT
jgi:hypothetical protein